MLLNSRPARAPLTHLERVRFMPTYDPNPSICLRSPPNVADPSSTLSDVTSAPVHTPNLCDPHRPKNPSSLRQVANTLEQPPRKLQHRLTLANLGTPGGKLVGFPRTCQQNLSVPKRVKFRGPEITIPPMPASSTTPTENIPARTQQPSDPLDMAPSSIVSDENTTLGSFVHTPTVFDRETPSADDFPDSPSVYSPTPPNSSAPSASYLSGSLRGLPKLAEVNPPVIVLDIGHLRPSLGQFLGEGSPNEQHHTGELSIGEQPHGEDISRSAPKNDPCGKVSSFGVAASVYPESGTSS